MAPGFTLAAVAAAIDVLALTNYVERKTLYRWYCLSADGKPVQAMNGLETLVDHAIHDAPWLDAITICCGVGGSDYVPAPRLSAWIRKRHQQGARIGAISTGSWCLARMNLLDGKRFTVHWEDTEPFSECFPGLFPSREIFEVDGNIYTCSGGTAAIDLFLSFVASRCGTDVANAVSEQLVHGPIRSHQESQRRGVRERLGTANRALLDAVTLMEENCETPLTLGDIAATVQVSGRQLERLFRAELETTPQLYYRSLRLQVAQKLLRRTTLSIRDIALAVGFSNSSYFATCYRQQFARLPTAERANRVGRHRCVTDKGSDSRHS